jgi:very-short-patch-repair endonuclease
MHLLRARAEQVIAEGLVASHATAALAHGLPLRVTDRAAEGTVHFVRARSPERRSRHSAGVQVHLGALPDHHVVRHADGLAVTSPARTVADLAGQLPAPEALMLADAALRAELGELTGTLRRSAYGNPRYRDAAARPLREAAEWLRGGRAARFRTLLEVADVRRESPLESFSAGQFMLAGLPRPAHQSRISTPAGDFYPDNLWEDFRLIGEADGEGKYADPGVVVKEKLRDGGFRDAGYEVLHWPGVEMWRAPATVVERIARLLVARGWDGVPRPWA